MKTRKEQFLEEMEKIILWTELSAVIEPNYPNPKKAGRKPIRIENMLRIHFLQNWFELSDPATDEAIYDSRAMRQFVSIDLDKEPAPDETTILKFRHLMEKHYLGDELFQQVNDYLIKNGLKVNRALLLMRRLLVRPHQPRRKIKPVTQRCARLKMATSGTLG